MIPFVRDHVQEGDVTIEYVGTSENAADILTKPLKGVSTSKMAQLIGLGMPLRGELKIHQHSNRT